MAEHNNDNNGRKEVGKVGIVACVAVVVLIAVVVFLIIQLQRRGEPDIPSESASKTGEVGVGKIGGDTEESEPSDSSDAAEENVYGENLFVSMEDSDWYFPSATEASTNAIVANSELNHCDVYFEITVDATGQLIYRSQTLAPGTVLRDIILGEELESGTYPCTMVYYLVNSDTGVEYEDNVVLGISITIQ